MSHGERAAWQENQRREVGSRRAGLRGWWNRGGFLKWLTRRKERRLAREEIRREEWERAIDAYNEAWRPRCETTGRHVWGFFQATDGRNGVRCYWCNLEGEITPKPAPLTTNSEPQPHD